MRVAVLGATGLVGREMIGLLEERDFPVDELLPLASPRSAGAEVLFRGRPWKIQAVTEQSFEGVDLALFSAGSGPSRLWAPLAARSGAVVVDNSSAWRMDPQTPLVVPEVNGKAALRHRGIIANPNCATIQAVVAAWPLHREASLSYLGAVTFQSVSGTGRDALEELEGGARAVLSGEEPVSSIYPHPIAFNALPHIGTFDDDGVSEEEWKMVRESRKIMDLPDLAVSCTTVRVPVFRGHSEALLLQFSSDLSPQRAREILCAAPGVVVVDEPALARYPLARETAGTDPVYVGRIRRDTGREKTLALWVVSDNLRKGAALNAVQICETLLEGGALRP
ncbi:MAG: aspartate-semialdehyde dehydrogenase [Synergistaceae bacterium]|nr:aspartate-semialdehyde dehydrogenase [Synergistaceae bacterium]